MSAYYWLKFLHLFFIIGWMAGLFYLPRIYVHYQYGKQEGANVERLKLMAEKLYSFMTLVGALGIGFGIWLWVEMGITQYWIHAKALAVFFLIVFHILCFYYLCKMKEDALVGSHVKFRLINEVPTILMAVILYLVVFKPF